MSKLMYGYRHYSFDLWLTLIKSNPMFKKQRSRYFHERFNRQHKPLEEVEHIFRQIDLMCNHTNERTGKNIDADEMYLMVINLINDNKICLHDIDIDALYQQMETLLFEHLPVIYCNRTAEVLACLKEYPEVTANILSNTGFIKGITLRKVLKELQIAQYFDFQIYSDEEGLSKPNIALFQLMIKRVLAIRSMPLTDMIHVGDNPVADIQGAQAAGINSLLVNSNDTSITNLIAHATSHLFPA